MITSTTGLAPKFTAWDTLHYGPYIGSLKTIDDVDDVWSADLRMSSTKVGDVNGYASLKDAERAVGALIDATPDQWAQIVAIQKDGNRYYGHDLWARGTGTNEDKIGPATPDLFVFDFGYEQWQHQDAARRNNVEALVIGPKYAMELDRKH